MLASSPNFCTSKPQYEPQHQTQPSLNHHRNRYIFPSPIPRSQRRSSTCSLSGLSKRKMVDASTQYSPRQSETPPEKQINTPDTNIVQTANQEGSKAEEQPSRHSPAEMRMSQPQSKRQASDSDLIAGFERGLGKTVMDDDAPSKKSKSATTQIVLSADYVQCDSKDLVTLISSMLMELIRYNDAIPLKDGHLTRFHSRAPPGISVHDYLQRLTTHATLPPPILLSMVYYIDRLCALYPAFTITSLTVHRFLIASATVASKGLSDSFWTNKTYARVGGVSVKELALLELEFLTRLEWRIVPKPEVLSDYYRSLVKRSETHTFGPDGIT